MSKTNVVLACMGVNVLLIGYVASPAHRQVNGIDSVRRELARDSERRMVAVVADELGGKSEEPEDVGPELRTPSHLLTHSTRAGVDKSLRNSDLPPAVREVMPAQFVNARRSQERPNFEAESIPIARATEARVSSQAQLAIAMVGAPPARVSSTTTAAARTPAEPLTSTAALAAEDGFEPVVPEPFHSPGSQDESSDFERRHNQPDRQAGILTPEDQQIRALHGWSAFQQFQRERVLQEIQEKGA